MPHKCIIFVSKNFMIKCNLQAEDVIKWRVLSKHSANSEFSIRRNSKKNNAFISELLEAIRPVIDKYRDLLK